MVPYGQVFCKRCQYDLAGLAAGPCPECEQPFDPSDAATFDRIPHGEGVRQSLTKVWIAAAIWPWVVNALAHVLLLVARLELGRWPHRFGMDDPKSIPWVRLLVYPLTLTFLFLWPSGVVLCLCSCLVRGRWQRVASLVLISWTIWLTGYIMMNLDPAQVWVWIMD